ncbi:MAG: hypothetical protein HS107_07525 [Thermoflexaceae bacterium]|nr:hypothetical protein [Thermoflexaceae bacterium]
MTASAEAAAATRTRRIALAFMVSPENGLASDIARLQWRVTAFPVNIW